MSRSSYQPNAFFWIIGVIALIWNLLGVYFYLMQAYQTDFFKSMYTPDQLEKIVNMPAWATAAFAIAVFGGALGSLLLLLKKRLANMVLSLSFLAIIVQFVYNFFIANTLEEYGYASLAMPVFTIAFGLFLVVYSKSCIRKGWLF
jgi:predicted benzoate:H+ symporter BenE